MTWSFLRRVEGPDAAPGTGLATWLVKDSLESYARWRQASAAVGLAYDGWRSGARPDRSLAFAAYLAALDREEHAARVFHRGRDRARAAGTGSCMAEVG